VVVVARTRDDEALVEAWRDIVARHARVSGALEKTLEREHGIGLTEFEVLERLASAGAEDQRMQEIAEAVCLSQSALSRLIGRLEADGLVERCMCPHDRRGINAVITDAGRERYAAARPTHRSVLAQQLV
jgi:DNA-binding MarR family transcriptional regulator